MSSATIPTTTQSLIRLIQPVRGRLIGATFMGAAATIARVAGLVALADVVRIVPADPSDASAVARRMGMALLAVVLSGLLRAGGSTVAHHAGYDHEVIVRRWVTEHLDRLPIGVVQGLGAGGLKKIISDDVRAMHVAIADTPVLLGASLAGPVASLAVLFAVQWRLALVVLVVVPVVVVIIKIVMRDHEEYRRQYDEAQEGVNAAVIEYVQGMQEVRTFDAGTDSFARFGDRVALFSERLAAWTAKSRTGALAVRLLIAPLPVIVVVAVAGGAMTLAGWVSVPHLLIALLLCPIPVESVLPMMWLGEFLNLSQAGASRIDAVLRETPLPTVEDPKIPVDGSVRLREVTFSYGQTRAPALVAVDLGIPDGTVCALVGGSGSGKSTIARLIARFFDVDNGGIEVGGVDVRQIDSATLLRHVALVFQDPFLLHASVRDNLTLGRPDATEAEIQTAAHAARAHDFILALPKGYDTMVGERGASLSGGQRQRLTIARAMLSDARVVVLDEPTSFADPENEAAIQAGLAELTRGRTVIVVAHRLSTITDADAIAVLHDGRIVEHGAHTELLAADGRYASLWARHQQAQAWGMRSGGDAASVKSSRDTNKSADAQADAPTQVRV